MFAKFRQLIALLQHVFEAYWAAYKYKYVHCTNSKHWSVNTEHKVYSFDISLICVRIKTVNIYTNVKKK
jgi:hypothetical protein